MFNFDQSTSNTIVNVRTLNLNSTSPELFSPFCEGTSKELHQIDVVAEPRFSASLTR
jgi:hypothetical protein